MPPPLRIRNTSVGSFMIALPTSEALIPEALICRSILTSSSLTVVLMGNVYQFIHSFVEPKIAIPRTLCVYWSWPIS